jgi:ATP-dependent RNA helicase RhlE
MESWSTLVNFEQFSLDPRILAGVNTVGYTTPTPIQEQAIPVVLAGKDILGLAQTGTGKTAAFVLPMLQHLSTGPLRQVRALIVAPTRELAEQIHQTIVDLGKNTKIRSITLYGGVGKGAQVSALRRGPEIVVACPGRLLDHIGDGNIDLSRVELLVLDEADRMCDMGFLPDVRRILGHLPKQRQTLFFSATMPTEIRTLADSILKDPVTVQIGMIAPAATVSHALYPVPEGLKKRLLLALLKTTVTGRTLIFTRTKRRARNLALDLSSEGYNVAALQGNMAQNRRLEAMNGFREGKYDILVATDIAARGIDVAEISHVINFDMPDTVDAYTHRIGRTGRALQTGEALTFAVPDDADLVRAVERVLGEKIERRQLSGFDYNGAKPDTLLQSAGVERARPAQSHRHSTANGGRSTPFTAPRAGQRPAQRQPAGGGVQSKSPERQQRPQGRGRPSSSS